MTLLNMTDVFVIGSAVVMFIFVVIAIAAYMMGGRGDWE